MPTKSYSPKSKITVTLSAQLVKELASLEEYYRSLTHAELKEDKEWTKISARSAPAPVE